MESCSSTPDNNTDDLGTYEVELFLGHQPETEECEFAWKTCKKNPGHEYFIPVKDFTIDKMPEDLRDENVFGVIQCLANTTVRVRVNYFSKDRLTYWPTAGAGFKSSSGTGCVYNYKEIEPGRGNCCCYTHEGDVIQRQSCDPNKQKRWLLVIRTASHVLYNDEEAKHAWVDFFFDNEDSLKEESLVSLKVNHVDCVKPKNDWCEFHCVTDNVQLVSKLYHSLTMLHGDHRDNISRRSWTKDLKDLDSVCIVSHPHGQPKQISFGNFVSVSKNLGRRYENKEVLCYNTPTCPGSSGARVSELINYFEYHMIHSTGVRQNINLAKFPFNGGARHF